MQAQDAIRRIQRQADRLRTINASDSRQAAFQQWFRETKAAFDEIFGPATGPNREFQEVMFQPARASRSDPDTDWREAYDRGIPIALSFFDSVLDDLAAHPDHAAGSGAPAARTPESRERPAGNASASPASTAVRAPERNRAAGEACLLVGAEESAAGDLAGFLERVGFPPATVGDTSDGAVAFLDRLEERGAAAFAVMFLSADEPGAGVRGKAPRTAPRPAHGRNLPLEIGILLGRLGRRNICVLHREGARLPPETEGIVCATLDARGAWKLDLARAMKNAGLPVDLNTALL